MCPRDIFDTRSISTKEQVNQKKRGRLRLAFTTTADVKSSESASSSHKISPSTTKTRSSSNHHSSNRYSSSIYDRISTDYNLVADLIANIEQYSYVDDTNVAWLSINIFPDNLRTCIQKVQSRTSAQTESKRPSIYVICRAALTHGLSQLLRLAEFGDLAEVKEEFEQTDFKESEEEELIASWFRKFPIVLTVPGSYSRQNLMIGQSLMTDLQQFSDDTGLKVSETAILCLMIVFSYQQDTHKQQRERMRELIESYVKMIKLRTKISRLIIDELA